MSRNSSTVESAPWATYLNRAPAYAGFELFDQGVVNYVQRDLSRDDIHRSRKENDGFRAPLPYSLIEKTHVPYRGDFKRPPPNPYSNGEWYVGDASRFFGYAVSAEVDLPGLNLVSRCETKCLLKVKDQKVHIGTTIAEANKTLKQVGDSVMDIVKAFRAVKSGNIKRAAGILGVPVPRKKGKDIASNWLALQYGWLPLYSDIHGAYDEIRKLTSDRPLRFSTTAAIRESLPSSFQPNISGSYSDSFNAVGTQEGYQVVKVNLVYEVNSRLMNDLSNNGLVNPLEVAWELVPFSFVVDWFLPIGDWMSALTADVGLIFRCGSLTKFVSNKRLATLTGKNDVTGLVYSSATYNRMERSVYSATPIPTPFVKSPVSTGHALNALALLRQLF